MSQPSATTQPGALDGAGLRRVVTVLSVTQITSWGVLYYAFAALSSSITTDTGWTSIQVTGAFSVAQLVSAAVGIWVGRHIDRVGPRRVMTVGSLIAVPGVVAIATAPNLAVFYVGWVVTGVAMAAVLYPPAFAALTRWGGDRRVGALTTLTLVAGLASTVFAPLASALDDWLDWRGAYLVLLAGLVVITVPLHWWGLRPRWVAARHRRLITRDGRGHTVADQKPDVRAVVRSRPFVLLAVAMALTSLAVFAVVINLVPMLVEQGMTRNLAAVALGLGGVGQVAGRLGYARFAARTTVTVRTVVVVAAVAVGHSGAGGRGELPGPSHRARDAGRPRPRDLHPDPGHRHHRPMGPSRVRHPQRRAHRPQPGRLRLGPVHRRRPRSRPRQLRPRLPRAGRPRRGSRDPVRLRHPAPPPVVAPDRKPKEPTMPDPRPDTPSVLFVCVKNGGKSQMAAGLMRQLAGDTIAVESAGTRPGSSVNELSAASLAEVGVDISDQTPSRSPTTSSGPPTSWSRSDATPTSTPSRDRVETGTPTSPPSAASTGSSGCAWSATTSPPGSASSRRGSVAHLPRDGTRATVVPGRRHRRRPGRAVRRLLPAPRRPHRLRPTT